MIKTMVVFLSLIFPYLACATVPGRFFEVIAQAEEYPLAISLCLNGRGPRSCQNYTVNSQEFSVRTLIPNHTYAAAGLKINTPGHTVANTNSGCTPTTTGYCLFTVSDKKIKTIKLTTTAAETTIGASVANLALKTDGIARKITIINTGFRPAHSVHYKVSPKLPPGTTITPRQCGTLAPGGSCVLTITPGAIANAAPGDINPHAVHLSITGDNTNVLTPTLHILDYGSVYQAGYLFAIDDTPASDRSIGGKVAALTDQTPPNSRVLWKAANKSCQKYTVSSLDGLPCSSSLETCYADWYLPQICEMGYGLSDDDPCGSSFSPAFPNLKSNLYDRGIGGLDGFYWSATEYSASLDMAWLQSYSIDSGFQEYKEKNQFGLKNRCARVLT